MHTLLLGIPDRKRPLGRHGRRWEDSIKIYIRQIGCEDVVHERVQWQTEGNGNEFLGFISDGIS
jgi:hypothetical protein